jgi:hypothetical protein
MARIVSTHTGPLGLPGGPVIRPHVPTEVQNWQVLRNHAVVRQWIEVGIISEIDDEPDENSEGEGGGDTQQPPTTHPLDHDKDGKPGGSKPVESDPERDRLKAEAKDLGIAVHHRWSKERIQEEIDKKLAE